MNRNELIQYLENFLSTKSFSDYAPNGLQIEGKEEIKKVVFAVSCTKESVQFAITQKADALIVHHGVLWKHQGAKPITEAYGKRLIPLIKHDINLLAYHLPLDAHMEVGNAAALAHLLDLKELIPFGEYQRMPLGIQAKLQNPLQASELKNKLEGILHHPVIMACEESDKLIHTIGIITGGANNDWTQAKAHGLDAYLTGEISEYNWHDAKEAGIAYYAGGHNATEQFGIQRLMNHLSKKFNFEATFFESDNPA